MKNYWIWFFCFILLAAPVEAAIVTPTERIEIEWTQEEESEGIAKKIPYEDSKSRHVAVRLRESEKPHTHDEDLTAWLVKGNAVLHIEDKSYLLTAGDVAWVPKHVMHWAELGDGEVCEVYAIYHKE